MLLVLLPGKLAVGDRPLSCLVEPLLGEPLLGEALLDESLLDEPLLDEPLLDELLLAKPLLGEPLLERPLPLGGDALPLTEGGGDGDGEALSTILPNLP